jgi:hypothetical protein
MTLRQKLRWELTQVLDPEADVLVIPLRSRCVERDGGNPLGVQRA